MGMAWPGPPTELVSKPYGESGVLIDNVGKSHSASLFPLHASDFVPLTGLPSLPPHCHDRWLPSSMAWPLEAALLMLW